MQVDEMRRLSADDCIQRAFLVDSRFGKDGGSIARRSSVIVEISLLRALRAGSREAMRLPIG
jgi:hypothetical protein